MQDAQLTFRLPSDLKEKIKRRAELESDRGTRVTVADIIVRTMSKAAAHWGSNGKD